MLHFSSPLQNTSTMPGNGRPVPPRTDSLRGAPEDALFSMLHDELHDMRRVQAYGQEEDLKEALGKTIGRVEELSAMLAQAYKAQSEIETTLKLARSNLQLALANNEMLEDALRRESGALGSKDVGWRRRSDRPDSRQGFRKDEPDSAAPSRRGSTSASGSGSSAAVSASAPTSPVAKPARSPPPMPPPPATANDTRFFRFRFGSSSASTSPNPNANTNGNKNSNTNTPPSSATTRAGTPPPLRKIVDASHLTSASLPSLVASTGKREEELVAELEVERAKYLKVSSEKNTLEAEVEGLSQALFEEANKMVAHERIKCAEIEEELRQVRQEKEALQSAMRVVEQENLRLRSPPLAQDKGDSRLISTLSGTSAEERSPSSEAGSSGTDGRERSRSRSRTRSESPSSTHGCRQKSSSSERGWASPESALHPGPEPELENELVLEPRANIDSGHIPSTETESETDAGSGQLAQERNLRRDKGHESERELGSFSPLTSPVPDMPAEESPWAR